MMIHLKSNSFKWERNVGKISILELRRIFKFKNIKELKFTIVSSKTGYLLQFNYTHMIKENGKKIYNFSTPFLQHPFIQEKPYCNIYVEVIGV